MFAMKRIRSVSREDSIQANDERAGYPSLCLQAACRNVDTGSPTVPGIRRFGMLLSVFALTFLIACQREKPIDTAEAVAAHAPAASSGDAHASERRNVFRSPLAGTWYDADANVLRQQIDGYVKQVKVERLADVCALILPHAGYRWSGPTAAYGIQQLQGRTFRRVVVLGPSHRVPMENVASVPDATHYATPLGEVPLDRTLIDRLLEHPMFQAIPYAHNGEHSVQIELPLLQYVLGKFSFVPIVVGQLDRPTMRRMGAVLASLVDQDTLVVASSDFTHYGQNYDYFPFRDNVAENLKKLDMESWNHIRQKSRDGLFDHIQKTRTTICGRCGIGILLSMLPKAAQAHLLHYDTSGHVGGDYSSSVSYLAIAFTGQWKAGQPVSAEPAALKLSDDEKQQLLKLARGTLTYALEHGEMPTPEQLHATITPSMRQIAGAFVTLHKKGQLRGCIGEIFPTRPLYRAVMAQAINAGLNDRRFSQVSASELAGIDFEISVLTPPHPVSGSDQIVIGKHGIVLKKQGHSAVFLPQVAPEQGWDLETTLSYLSAKAGLARDAWRQGASFDVFEAIVFGEKDTERSESNSD